MPLFVRSHVPRPPDKGDISIAKDQWILVEPLPKAPHTHIDTFLAPAMPFLLSLETDCVAACCGIDAFCLWPEAIYKSLAAMQPDEVRKLASAITTIQNQLEQSPFDIFISSRMNQCFEKSVLLALLTHLRTEIENASRLI